MNAFLSPASIAMGMMFVNIIISGLILGATELAVMLALLMSCGIVLTTVLGKMLVNGGPGVLSVEGREAQIHLPLGKLVNAVGIAFGAYVVVRLYQNSGQTNPFLVAAHYSALRYKEELGIPMDVRLANAVLYFSYFISVLSYFSHRKNSSRTANLFRLLPGSFLVLEALLLGTKSIIVLVGIYALVAFRVSCIIHGRRLNAAAFLFKSTLVVAASVAIVIAVQSLRSSGNMAVSDIIFRVLTSYSTVPTMAFLHEAGNIDYFVGVGLKTIAGVPNMLGIALERQGDFIVFRAGDRFLHTNVYTAYHHILHDFGILGLVAFFVSIVCLIPALERKIQRGRISFVGIYSIASIFILFAFADTLLKFSTNVIVFALLLLYFSFVPTRRKPHR